MKKIFILILISFGLSAQQSVTIPSVTTNTGTGYVEVLAGSLGVDVYPSAQLLLDAYPNATIAYSLSKLKTSYSGNCIRVRRSSDNAESDIGFSGNDLNTTQLSTFVGANNAFITKWYDQSGNANDLVQAAAVSQPQIMTVGVLKTVNGKAAMTFDGVNDFMSLTSTISAAVSWSIFQVSDRRVAAKMGFVMSNVGAAFPPTTIMHYTDNNVYISAGTTAYNSSSTDTGIAQKIWSGVRNGTAGYIWKNGTTVTMTNFAATSVGTFDLVGKRASVPIFTDGNVQCFIFYASDKTSSISGINSKINAYFSVY